VDVVTLMTMKRRRVGLWWIFGCIGFVGAWLTAIAYGLDPWDLKPLVMLLTSCTTVAAAVLGAASEHCVRNDMLGVVAGLIVVSGMLNGLLIGLLVGGAAGALVGVVFGFAHALSFFLPLMLIAVAARRVGSARDNSVMDQTHRRAVLKVASFVTALGIGFVWVLLGMPLEPVTIAAGTGACIATCALVVIEHIAARRMRDRELAWAGAAPCEQPADRGLPVTDFGVGDEWRVRHNPAVSAYRDAETPAELFYGQPGCAPP
jgi:hypothetical protein